MSISTESSESWEAPEWIDSIVTLLVIRDAPDPRDHESMAGLLMRPTWVKNLDSIYFDSWSSYPKTRKEATASTFGLKLGKHFGGIFAGFELLDENPVLLQEVIQKSLSYIDKDVPEGEESIGAELIEILREQSEEQLESARELISQIVRIVFRQRFEDLANFSAGFGRGLSTWLNEDAFQDPENERVLMARVLLDRWDLAEAASTIQEVSQMVLDGMNPQKKKLVEGSPEASVAFEENFRKLCSRIELKKGGRGRPRKN